ncbi:MAG: cyclic pyranopterin monophosphate synthase MoaC [Desulfurococcales archaeon]|nr:cyclic pyranopterin monophosphate synthase MoaC [Desulfurococcales archaeon]
MAGGVRMVDVSSKPVTVRTVEARGFVRLRRETLEAIREGRVPKGDVLTVARVAGVMAAKRAWELVPLAHPISIEHVEVDVNVADGGLEVVARVKSVARTGPELEALAAVMGALLAAWDMVKQLEKDERGLYPESEITGIRVTFKSKEPLETQG